MIEPSLSTHRYISFLLRLWQEGTGEPWRASLEDPLTGERKSFGDAEALFQYLQNYMQDLVGDNPEEV